MDFSIKNAKEVKGFIAILTAADVVFLFIGGGITTTVSGCKVLCFNFRLCLIPVGNRTNIEDNLANLSLSANPKMNSQRR